MQPSGLKCWSKSRTRTSKIVREPFILPTRWVALELSMRLTVLKSTDSIYLSMTPRPTLFASFKYIGNNFDSDMARMAANSKVQEWWRMTDSMQESPVEGAQGSATGPGWWGQTEEVFYVE